MVAEIDAARKANESLGGVYEAIAFGLVPGIGSHLSWDDRLDGRLAMAIMSIQAMKGVGIGDGFDLAGRVGSQAHDEIFYSEEQGFFRETNRAGGVEGGMTTGDPVVVSGAMKPLPTLTKPLRSVDLETKEPAAGAARAHRLVHGARRRRDRGGDDGPGAGRRLPREVRRRPHRRRPGRAGRLQGPDRMEALTSALVFIGFMGAGKSSSARSVAAELGLEPLDSDRELERELGEPIEAFFDREGEPAFRAREEEVVLRLLERANGGVVALGGGAAESERVREALRDHTVVHLEVAPERGVAARVGQGPPARPRPRPLRPAALRSRRGLRLGLRRGDPTVAARHAAGAPCRRCWPCATRRHRSRLVWARAASGDYPVFVGRGLIRSGFFFPDDGRRFAVTDENVATLHPLEAEHTVAIPAGEETKVLDTAELVLRRLAQAGRRARRPGGRGRRRGGG